MRFAITYFPPYDIANFSCSATTLKDAVKKFRAFNKKLGYDIANREIKKVAFDGKPVDTNQL